MYVLKLPLCLRDFFGMFFEAVFVVSIKADPALGVPYGNDLQSPGVFGTCYCMLFQKGTFTYWSCFDGMAPRNLHKWVFAADLCIGICSHIFIPGREKHKCGYCLCADSSRVDGVSCC